MHTGYIISLYQQNYYEIEQNKIINAWLKNIELFGLCLSKKITNV